MVGLVTLVQMVRKWSDVRIMAVNKRKILSLDKALVDNRLRPRCATHNQYFWSLSLSKKLVVISASRLLCLPWSRTDTQGDTRQSALWATWTNNVASNYTSAVNKKS